ARAMGYRGLEARALEQVEGRTIFTEFEKIVAHRQAQDEDALLANEPDDKIREMAKFSIETFHLPADRLPVVEREWFSQRMIAREKVNFCKHIELLQNTSHQQSPLTHYRTDPPRACHCEKFGYQSKIQSPDADAVIRAFKGTFCNSCPSR